jgi:hypothetical protein
MPLQRIEVEGIELELAAADKPSGGVMIGSSVAKPTARGCLIVTPPVGFSLFQNNIK